MLQRRQRTFHGEWEGCVSNKFIIFDQDKSVLFIADNQHPHQDKFILFIADYQHPHQHRGSVKFTYIDIIIFISQSFR